MPAGKLLLVKSRNYRSVPRKSKNMKISNFVSINKGPRPSKAMNSIVKTVINRQAESKRAMFYGNDTAGVSASGLLADWKYAPHNQYIGDNVTDIHRIIPYVLPGNDDNQRNGNKITPKSLIIRGNMKVNLPDTPPAGPIEVFAVIYVLQHQILKSYTSLDVSGNNFSQLLDTGENATTAFGGIAVHAQLPVASQYYRLLKKLVIPLRYSGVTNPTGTPAYTSLANSHNVNKEFTINLTKHLPAKFTYPEVGAAAAGLNDPTNSSIFMCCAYYNMDGSAPSPAKSVIALQYHSELSYKDI